MLQQLLKRIEQIELTGKVDRRRSNFLAGIKYLPVSLHAIARRRLVGER